MVFKGKWNFDWQVGYQLAKPLPLPKGTRLLAIAHYDNSPNNKYNPDPTKDDPLGRSELGRDAVRVPGPGGGREHRCGQGFHSVRAQPAAARQVGPDARNCDGSGEVVGKSSPRRTPRGFSSPGRSIFSRHSLHCYDLQHPMRTHAEAISIGVSGRSERRPSFKEGPCLRIIVNWSRC